MSARVLTLPRTRGGREMLRTAVRFAGGWDFPEGSKADDPSTDWDRIATEFEQDQAKLEQEGAS